VSKAVGGVIIVGFMVLLVFAALRFSRRLLPITPYIDGISKAAGVIAAWLVLLSCLVSSINATVRYLFNSSSNAWLELQWYMFAGMVLLGAAETLRRNEHVRVDLIYGAVSNRTREWIDLLGGIVFLMPMCVIMIYFTWPVFVESWRFNEMSSNAGGLVRWPVKLLLPAGFFFVLLQGISEIIKRAAALTGLAVEEIAYEKPLQ
jgi:TRAP-type mannitol/chloroaromatic compound transport system permease small subunit